MDYKDGSYYGNDIVISLTYNCMSWISIFTRETLPKILIILEVSGLSVFRCGTLGTWLLGVLQSSGGNDLFPLPFVIDYLYFVTWLIIGLARTLYGFG